MTENTMKKVAQSVGRQQNQRVCCEMLTVALGGSIPVLEEH